MDVKTKLLVLILMFYGIGDCASAERQILSLESAEKLFLQNNFELIAARYGLEAEKALVIQASLWPNPELELGQSIYNKEKRTHFDTSASGQTEFKLMQAIPLAGKIRKAEKAAGMSAASVEEEYFSTLRRLKLELRTTYFQLHFKKKILDFYNESLTHLNKTLEITENNFKQGHVTLIEQMRIRGIVFEVEDEQRNLLQEVKELYENMYVFIGSSTINFETAIAQKILEREYTESIPDLNSLISLAFDSRPDLRSLKLSYKSEKFKHEYERANAWPELKLGGQYDRQSNYIRDYYGVVLSLEIPLFDRNQGNIKAAKARMKASEAKINHRILEIEKEVRLSHQNILEIEKVFSSYKRKFSKGFSQLTELLNANYQKKYISNLQFSDSFDALRGTVTRYLNLQAERLIGIEKLNYTVGKEVIQFVNDRGLKNENTNNPSSN